MSIPKSLALMLAGRSKNILSRQSTQTSTSLSARTFVLFRYDPCTMTLIFRLSKGGLASMALRITDIALSPFASSVWLGGFAQLVNLFSQLSDIFKQKRTSVHMQLFYHISIRMFICRPISIDSLSRPANPRYPVPKSSIPWLFMHL